MPSADHSAAHPGVAVKPISIGHNARETARIRYTKLQISDQILRILHPVLRHHYDISTLKQNVLLEFLAFLNL